MIKSHQVGCVDSSSSSSSSVSVVVVAAAAAAAVCLFACLLARLSACSLE